MKKYWVYILSSKKRGTLYIGVTNNITSRTYQHKQQLTKSFTKKYNIKLLVYTEEYSSIFEAISREKNLKNWKRSWKIKLIETINKDWIDLSDSY